MTFTDWQARSARESGTGRGAEPRTPWGRLLGALVLSILPFMPSCGGGGGGGGAPIETLAYDVGLTAVARGIQVGRPFAVRVDFFEPGTEEPIVVPESEVVTATLLLASSGEPVSSMSVSPGAGGDSMVVFDGLVASESGDHLVRIEGPNATAATDTNTFTVGPQLDLAVDAFPSALFVGTPLALTVRVVDPATGDPAAPGYPVDVRVEVGDAADVLTGTIGPTSTSIEIVGPVPDPGTAETRIAVRSFGFPAVLSGSLAVDRAILRDIARGGSPLVNGLFTVQGRLVVESTGAPLPGPTARFVDVALAGTPQGMLTGNTTGFVGADGTFSVGPLSYDADDELVLSVTSEGAPDVDLMVAFAYEIDLVAEGSTMAVGNEPVGPFAVRILDAFGAPSPAPSPITWSVTRVADDVEVAAGTGDFVDVGGGELVARFVPGGFDRRGDYRVDVDSGAEPRTQGPATFGFSVEFDTEGAPGAFVPLRSARVGSAFADDAIPFAAGVSGPVSGSGPLFGLLDGEVPPGLTIDPNDGEVTGAPAQTGSFEFVAFARTSATAIRPVRCALSVFSADESELDGAVFDFRAVGPQAGSIAVEDDAFDFRSSFDGIDYSTSVRIWTPQAAAGPVPLVVFHRARSVLHTDYDGLARHLASWGIAVASVDDHQSFLDGSGRMPNATYDGIVAWAGMESGAAFLEAAAERVLARVVAEGDALEGLIDTDAVFFAGHGWGGGSVQAAHQRFRSNNARGYIYLMPLDLRVFPGAEPPGDPQGTPAYPIPTAQPRVPQLVVAAQNDDEMQYPFADQIHERRDGPSTMVTIYGGCNCFETDARDYDAVTASITRAEQQAESRHLVTAFVKRWSGSLDRALDVALYRDVAPASDVVAVQTWRNMAETTLVDDYQDADPASNLLGGLNVLTDGSRGEESIYPNVGMGFDTLGVQQNIAFLSGIPDSTFSTAFPPLDASDARRVAMRIGQLTQNGFDWLTVRVRLIDGSGTSSAVTVQDRTTGTGRLPTGTARVFDRFVDLEVAFDEFDPTLDVSDLRRIELVFVGDGATGFARQVFLDDLRVE